MKKIISMALVLTLIFAFAGVVLAGEELKKVKGKIISVDSDKNTVTIKDEKGKETEVYYDPDAEYALSGAVGEDIECDYISEADKNVAKNLVLKVKGEIVRKDSDKNTVTIKDEKGKETEVVFDPDAPYMIEDVGEEVECDFEIDGSKKVLKNIKKIE